ncbi:histidinol phosphatase and related hydrolases of the PHP family [Moorella thermoacetica Y72]|uniref:DNA polymerase beta n=1 Tax=Moorella thermoacetica Y72 TaxID=1325331 RepID=A0A0S6UAE9_NEOTH|nr:PHP domain-containing protein [Moorella thermoacetica]GAF24888.1 histidinol phosphatase and related hydrolases of the PHP family [Moorella thermoacetica Y72]
MTNLELAWALAEMGDLLELKGEEPFKVRAYHRAARSLENLEEEAADLYARGALEEIPGVGKNLAKKLAELLTTGRSTFLDNLRREVPPGLREMLAIPGLGSRTVRQIHQGLGITTLAELEQAARERRIRTLPGLGSKTELAILRGLEMLREVQDRVPLGVARPLALLLRAQLLALPGVVRAEIAGSVRRGKEMVEDIDLVAAVEPDNQVAAVLVRHPQVKEVLAREPDRLALQTNLGLKIEVIMVPPEDFPATLFYATGSKAHRRALLRLAAERGLGAADLGLVTPRWLAEEEDVLAGGTTEAPGKGGGSHGEAAAAFATSGATAKEDTPGVAGGAPGTGVPPAHAGAPLTHAGTGTNAREEHAGVREPVEAAFYQRLGLPYIVPELREDRGELAAARRGELPHLVTLADIRGDLHMHSRYSDGVETIAAMAAAARARGYQYIAITDHSRSLTVARGLSLEQLKAQREEIARLNEELEGITILAGIEVDILADGRLDYEDEVLKEFDLVIASIHSGFRQEREQIMARLEAALRNPYVDILGHPTGRMLGRRQPYAVDVKRVIELAAETGTILEINASPERLDLNDTSARLAKEYGVPIAIDTDAHDPHRLADMEYGVLTARRGWLEPADVVNTWELERLLAGLKRNRHGA